MTFGRLVAAKKKEGSKSTVMRGGQPRRGMASPISEYNGIVEMKIDPKLQGVDQGDEPLQAIRDRLEQAKSETKAFGRLWPEGSRVVSSEKVDVDGTTLRVGVGIGVS